MPNLIEVQKSSYDHFLQMDVQPEQRTNVGLQEVFKSVFPIRDFSDRARLEFVRYELEAPKYDVEECQQRGITFAAPLKVTLRLVVFDVERGHRLALDPRHQGAGRLHGRHAADDRRTAPSSSTAPSASSSRRCTARRACSSTTTRARPIPRANISSPPASFPIAARGSISSSTPRTIVYVRIDRRRKLPVTTLLFALDGVETEKLRAERAADGKTLAAA